MALRPHLLLVLVLAVAGAVSLDANPASAQATYMPFDDRVRIAEGRRIADEFSDKLWRGWSNAPFAILLVTKEKEFLVYHAQPSTDFTSIGFDSLLQSDVHVRDRIYDPGLLATFPAVGGVATIVIGQPKNTEASHSARWVITLLHEHFHQWQMSQPDYYPSVNALGLSDKDDSGMWMLDYPFPYEDKGVGEAFRELCHQLRDAVSGEGLSQSQLASYLVARAKLRNVLSQDDYAYFSFQVWQEGIARYTEYMIASKAVVAYQPTKDFQDLTDVVPFDEVAAGIRELVMNELLAISLKESKRRTFYFIGAAEGLLLDHVNPGWRDRYMEERFMVERFLEPARGAAD